MEFTTKPKNWQFSYSTEYENRLWEVEPQQ